MEEGARDMRLVSHTADEPFPADEPHKGLSAEDLDAARELAEFHRLLATDLAPRSQLRGLMLRCAGHWSRLGEIPRNGLSGVDDDGSD
jgi:hypothetical protein